MATISKRGDLQWQAKIRRNGQAPQSKTFNTKSDAEIWARTIESEMDRGVFVSRVEAENTTMATALDRYAKEVTPLKKGAARELDRINRWKSNPLSHRYLATIRGSDLAKFRDDWRAAGKAENTIRLELALLSQLFETARKEWGMESLGNPVRNIKAPAGSKQRDRRLQDEEEEYLLTALAKGRNPAACGIVEFALETAMRQSEILGLTWESVDIKQRTAFLKDTKNGESRRVPMSTKALALLNTLPRPLKGGRIFRMTQDGLIRAFARACAAGRIEYEANSLGVSIEPNKSFLADLRFHDLRHEATTRFFERGLDIMEVAAITGHKTLAMLKRYTHLRAEDLAKKLG